MNQERPKRHDRVAWIEGDEVLYLGQLAGRFRLDLVVEAKVLVECKATEGPAPRHSRFIRPDLLKRLDGNNIGPDERQLRRTR